MEITNLNKEDFLNNLLKQNKQVLYYDIKETLKIQQECYENSDPWSSSNGYGFKFFAIKTIEELIELKVQFNLIGCPEEINTPIIEKNGKTSAYRIVYLISSENGIVIYALDENWWNDSIDKR